MGRIYSHVDRLIGRTPMIELGKIKRKFGLSASIFAKLEGANPSGSVKDRAAGAMIARAEAEGRLQAGSVIVEASSGNTGISLAMLSAGRYRCMIVMPDTASEERAKIIRAYGGETEIISGGMSKAIMRVKSLMEDEKNVFVPDQFNNQENSEIHERTTGPEIFYDMAGGIDAFVCGVGSGGSISGVARYLKRKCPSVRIIAVEPEESAILSGKEAAPHKIEGIGAGFVPPLFQRDVVDKIITASFEEAKFGQEILALEEGIFAGFSSGAALFTGIRIAKRREFRGKRICILLPDRGERYLSKIQN